MGEKVKVNKPDRQLLSNLIYILFKARYTVFHRTSPPLFSAGNIFLAFKSKDDTKRLEQIQKI